MRRRSGRVPLGLGHVLAPRGEDGVEDGALHARHEFNHASDAYVLDQAVNDLISKLAMGHLAATEAKTRFHLIALSEEADGLILLGLVVVLVDGDGELDLFDDDDFLLLLGGAFALFFLVEEAAVVLDAADGRNGVGRDFYQVQAAFASNLQGFERGQNAELFAVFVDDADFAGANPVVNADKGLC